MPIAGGGGADGADVATVDVAAGGLAAAWPSMRFGGGANAFVGMGATTAWAGTCGWAPRTSSRGSVGSSDNSLKRVAAYSTRSRGWPYV